MRPCKSTAGGRGAIFPGSCIPFGGLDLETGTPAGQSPDSALNDVCRTRDHCPSRSLR
jgi:hypothetical protein